MNFQIEESQQRRRNQLSLTLPLWFTPCAATEAWSISTAWSARTKCLCTTCCWRCWTLTASTGRTDQPSPGRRLTESLPSSTKTAAAVGAPLQLDRAHVYVATTRAWLKPPWLQVSCSTEGPALTARMSYKTKHIWGPKVISIGYTCSPERKGFRNKDNGCILINLMR